MTDFAAIDFLCWRQHKKSFVIFVLDEKRQVFRTACL